MVEKQETPGSTSSPTAPVTELVEAPKRRSKIKYIGEGAHIYGVPARDLTPDEYNEHKKTILSYPTAADLYRLPEGDEPAKPKRRILRDEAVTNG